MTRYLTKDQLKTNLRLGRTVEQWLGATREEDYVILKWISIQKEGDQGYSVTYIESIDEGDEDFLDIYEFSSVDPDEPFGRTATFSSIDDALKYVAHSYSASNIKYVSRGLIQEEYTRYKER